MTGRLDSTQKRFVFSSGYFSMKLLVVVPIKKLKQEQPQAETGQIKGLSLVPLPVSMGEEVNA